MNELQQLIENIETFTVKANGEIFSYEDLGFELSNIEYNVKDDELTFALKNAEHEIFQLWELQNAYEGRPDNLRIYDLNSYNVHALITMSLSDNMNDFFRELSDNMVAYNPKAQVE